MVIGIKETAKLIGISIVSCCAVLICTMFLNYYFDVLEIEGSIASEQGVAMYHMQVSTAKIVCLVSGCCLLATSVVMLLFYIRHYIDTHKKELGILKALGYPNLKIAKNFWIFGSSVFLGTSLGIAGAFLLMPSFYQFQNKENLLPELTIQFHPSILFYFVALPTIAFAALAILYASIQLRMPVLALIKEDVPAVSTPRKYNAPNGAPFLAGLKRSTLSSKKALVFFITFASFCFSSMTQMSASMDKFSSRMMGYMMLSIGIILACTTLALAITTVVKGNTKTIAMMRVFGYSQKECCKALLGGYRPFTYLGFALGSIYQYALLRIMVDIVLKGMEGIPEYEFDVPTLLVSFLSFLIFYEVVIRCYSRQIKNVSLKEIML